MTENEKALGNRLVGLKGAWTITETGVVEQFNITKLVGTHTDDGMSEYTFRFFNETKNTEFDFDLSQQQVNELLESGETAVSDEDIISVVNK